MIPSDYTYLLVNLLSIAVPFAFSSHPRLEFYQTWRAFWPACLITAAAFLAWDVLYTHLGVWGFNPRYLLGIDLLNLPLEEVLFFICIPYACTFTYACLKRLVPSDPLAGIARPVTLALTILLVTTAALSGGRLYTTVTFVLCAAFLIAHLLVYDADYMGWFYLSYAVIFAGPFLLVNGILTGSFLEEQVVWYNDAENLGVRAFTIPIEDFIYGLLLYLMNVTLYERFLRKNVATGDGS